MLNLDTGQSQKHKGNPKTCTNLIPECGSNWESSGFSRNQSNRGSLSAYVTYCGLSMKINMRKTLHSAQRSWMHLFCVCFCLCGLKTGRPQIWALWLMMPLHRAVYEVWDRPCLSVCGANRWDIWVRTSYPWFRGVKLYRAGSLLKYDLGRDVLLRLEKKTHF